LEVVGVSSRERVVLPSQVEEEGFGWDADIDGPEGEVSLSFVGGVVRVRVGVETIVEEGGEEVGGALNGSSQVDGGTWS